MFTLTQQQVEQLTSVSYQGGDWLFAPIVDLQG
jgi:hypothetical protein